MHLASWLVPALIAVVVLALAVVVFALHYRKVGPNEALIISSGRKRLVTLADGTQKRVGYRYRLGGGTFIKPFIEKVYVMPMDITSIDIRTPEVMTHGNVPIMTESTAQVKIDSSDSSIYMAAEHFLGLGRDGMRDIAANILEGKVREVIGTMTVEEIYLNRQEFSARVLASAKEDFGRMGLVVLSYALKDVSDSQGYLEALSRPQVAAAKRDAAIAQAETEKEAVIKSSQARKEAEVARLQAEALIAKAQWENEAKRAESLSLVNARKAQADLSYEIERNRIGQELKKEEAKLRQVEKQEAIKIEELEIARKQKELESSVIKPADARKYQIRAEAEAEEFRISAEARGKAEALRSEGDAEAGRIRALGLAEAEAMTGKAAAWGKYNDAAMLEMYIRILPELAKAVSEPLSRIDKIVIVGGGGDKELGTSKITGQVAQVLAQMPEVVKSLTGADLSGFIKEKFSPKKEEKKDD